MSATLPGANSASLPPAILGQRYRLERRLAQGGMAEVWLATDLSLTRQVAVKLLKPTLAADPVLAERFRREAIAVAQLSHQNIVAVYDAIEEKIGGERRQAVVMQLINGKSLRQLLDEQKRLSPDLTMHIGACVAAALDAAHRGGLVHRDVKPGNILITPDGRVLLTDFGIAKGLDGDGDDLTSPNVMMGTAKYLSPEQVRGRKLDGRADLYSLGLVLYECLAGRVPFLGETDADTALARLNRDPTDLTRLRPTLPYGLAPLIHRLLARKPDDRYASGAELRHELQRIAALPRPDATTDHSRETGRATPPRGNRVPGSTTTAPMAPSGSRTAATTARQSPVGPTRSATPVGGYQPVRNGRPAGSPRLADRTPTNTARPRQRPNRQYEQRTGPSLMVVGGLLVAALLVATVLIVTMGTGGTSDDLPATTVVPTTAPPVTDAVTPAAGAGIAAIHTFDPDGDGEERDDLAALAIDGNPDTAWTTVCYANEYLGGKQGVGLVLDLGGAASGVLTIDIASAPYQVRVYSTSAATAPTTFGAWGNPVDSFAGAEPQVATAVVSDATYVLVSFVQLGTDAGCSNNPYRGSLREITFG
ncbi:MAG: protein kinase [Ilumatobacteraceae bacterium]|nr:protein kinase [Ilumatobacter sp.]MCO5329796.1 protein kinase [Ilumatobacteraceae bacterium]